MIYPKTILFSHIRPLYHRTRVDHRTFVVSLLQNFLENPLKKPGSASLVIKMIFKKSTIYENSYIEIYMLEFQAQGFCDPVLCDYLGLPRRAHELQCVRRCSTVDSEWLPTGIPCLP